jgi:hypothetical protein
MEHEEQEEQEDACSECRGPLAMGVQVWSVREGVLGTRGFVVLEEELLFCSDECLRGYFAEPAEYTMPRRIP